MVKKVNNIDLVDLDLEASEKRFKALIEEEELEEDPVFRGLVTTYLNDFKVLIEMKKAQEAATAISTRAALRREARQYSSAMTKSLAEISKLLKNIRYERRVSGEQCNKKVKVDLEDMAALEKQFSAG